VLPNITGPVNAGFTERGRTGIPRSPLFDEFITELGRERESPLHGHNRIDRQPLTNIPPAPRASVQTVSPVSKGKCVARTRHAHIPERRSSPVPLSAPEVERIQSQGRLSARGGAFASLRRQSSSTGLHARAARSLAESVVQVHLQGVVGTIRLRKIVQVFASAGFALIAVGTYRGLAGTARRLSRGEVTGIGCRTRRRRDKSRETVVGIDTDELMISVGSDIIR